MKSQESKMSDQKYVCIDLDGTIAHYDEWKDVRHFGDPIPGVQDALQRLRTEGWKMIIYTTRRNKKLVADYLNSHAIPFDYINENPDQPKNAAGGKPIANAYIDDRGIQFNGDWQMTANEVLQFVPWEKRKKPDPADEYRKEAVSFLGRDYGEAFSQLRAYDTQIWEIMKYSFGQLVGSVAAVWVIFTLSNGANPPAILRDVWKLVSSIILMISFFFGLLAIQLILRNRVYYSAVARYINDQREFFFSIKPIGFSNRSKYYTDWNKPEPFNASSSQILMVYVIALISALLLGLSAGLFGYYLDLKVEWAVIFGIVAWLNSFVGSTWYALQYLENKKPQPRRDAALNNV
jgi:hypothetical protein